MDKQFDINKFNSFLEQAQNAISCGPECQKEETAEKLKQKYNRAQANLILAEPNFQVARKNYYTYVSGEGAYNEMIEQELSMKADKMTDRFNESIDEEINKIQSQVQTYNGLIINLRNLLDLYKKYKRENMELHKQIKTETNDILTNNRKTYYEDQENENLNNYYYYILILIYIVVVICFIIFSLIYPSNMTLKGKIIAILFFVILPFISTRILGTIVSFGYWLFSLFPKNVYK